MWVGGTDRAAETGKADWTALHHDSAGRGLGF